MIKEWFLDNLGKGCINFLSEFISTQPVSLDKHFFKQQKQEFALHRLDEAAQKELQEKKVLFMQLMHHMAQSNI